MNYLDIIIIVPLIWGTYKGFKKGIIIEAATFIALGLGIWGGLKFSSISAKYLSQVFDIAENIMPLISFVVTFIIIVILVFALAKIIQKFVKIIALGFLNKAAGGLFGLLKFSLILSVIINLVNIINRQITFIDSENQNTSILYNPVGKVAQIIIPELKELNINAVVDNVISDELSKKIDETTVKLSE